MPASILPFRRLRRPAPCVASFTVTFTDTPPETSVKAPEQVSDVILWLDAQYDVVCAARDWDQLRPRERVQRLQGRMDDHGRALNIDTVELKALERLMPMLEQRARARALAETHRIIRNQTDT